MKTFARLMFVASMLLAGLSLSAYGVALAAPGLRVSGPAQNSALIQSDETTAGAVAALATDAPEVTKSSEVTESLEAKESPDVAESHRATQPARVENPNILGHADGSGSDVQIEKTGSTGGSNTDGEKTGSNGRGESGGAAGGSGNGDGYQPSRAGWTAVPVMSMQAEL